LNCKVKYLFEPVVISTMDNTPEWFHPEIDNICEFSDSTYNKGLWCVSPLMRVWIKNPTTDKLMMHIVVRSYKLCNS
jgi:hypothetical protein